MTELHRLYFKKKEDCHDFKARVDYLVSFRAFWVIVRDCLKTRERKLKQIDMSPK